MKKILLILCILITSHASAYQATVTIRNTTPSDVLPILFKALVENNSDDIRITPITKENKLILSCIARLRNDRNSTIHQMIEYKGYECKPVGEGEITLQPIDNDTIVKIKAKITDDFFALAKAANNVDEDIVKKIVVTMENTFTKNIGSR